MFWETWKLDENATKEDEDSGPEPSDDLPNFIEEVEDEDSETTLSIELAGEIFGKINEDFAKFRWWFTTVDPLMLILREDLPFLKVVVRAKPVWEPEVGFVKAMPGTPFALLEATVDCCLAVAPTNKEQNCICCKCTSFFTFIFCK